MTLLTSPKPDTWAALTALAAGTVTWQPAALVAGLLTARTVLGLLAEWQARRTLVALAGAAPAGLIMIHRTASRGHAFWLLWRADSDQHPQQSRT